LTAAVFFAYLPAWHGDFIWDDDLHLLNNPVLEPGGLLRTWVPGTYVNYWPVTATAYRLQFELWGLRPVGYHLVNIALHALAALLVWRILAHLRVPGAMFAAALFALHPVNVESVAWITQLKNTLSLSLTLLSVLFYLRHERYGGRWRSALAIGLFCLATLAKGMTLTLPVILLACAWWQRGRIQRRDLLQVLPYVLIGALMACTEVCLQHVSAGGAIVRSDDLLSRTAVAGCAVWFYFWKLVWLAHLVFVYPRWNLDERDVLSYLPGLLLAGILALAWWRRRSWSRPILMLVVCYVALLLPALGFVNIYFMEYSLVADHWQYAAMIAPCAAFAGLVSCRLSVVGCRLQRTTDNGQRTFLLRPLSLAGYAACVALLATLAVLTRQQARMYTDVERLYRTTLQRNPDCWMAHLNLGVALADRGRIDDAMGHTKRP
jgi:hypothetical protein